MRKNIPYIVGIIIILCLAGCRHRKETTGPASQKKLPSVVVQTIEKAEISQNLVLTGEVVATNSVVIASTIEGPVKFCPWREGDSVQKGQKLIEIDRQIYKKEVDVAEATLRVAQARLKDMEIGTRPEEIAKARETVKQLEESTSFARNDMERITQLVKNGALPGEMQEKARMEYITQQTRLQSAKEHLEMLESGYTKTALAIQQALVDEAASRLELARARLAETLINSPVAGIITKVHITPGSIASVKAPLLEIIDTSSLVIKTAVPEANATRLRKDMPARVTLDAYPQQIFSGKVNRIYPDLDNQLRTRTVEIILTDKVNLMPGMFARIELLIEFVKNAVVIPEETIIVTPEGEEVVFIIDGNKAVQRKVTTGVQDKGKIQILTGLHPGEKVVIAGHEKLKNGQEVRLVGPGEPEGQPVRGKSKGQQPES